MEAKERDTYPPQITTIYSVWIPSDQDDPNSIKKPYGSTHLWPQAAADLAKRYRGEVRELTL